MKLDLSKVRVTGRDKDCTTLKHYAGHEIKIVHSKLSKENKEALDQLHSKFEESSKKRAAKMAEGGKVPTPAPDQSQPKTPPPMPKIEVQGASGRSWEDVKKTMMNPQSWLAEGGMIPPNVGMPEQPQVLSKDQQFALNEYMKPEEKPQAEPNPQAVEEQARREALYQQLAASQPNNPQAQAPGMAPEASPQMPDMGSSMPQQPQAAAPANINQNYNQMMQQGIDMQKEALGEQFKAASQLGAQRAIADKAYMDQTAALNKQIQDQFAGNSKQIDATIADIASNRINPNAYMESRSSGQKAMAAIGLMAGGFSQAYGGGPNPAMQWINNQIDRDIRAQESNQNSKVTLLNAYQQQFKNKMAAGDMARATLHALYASQMSLAANNAATPQAKAQMMAGVGQLQMKAAELAKSATINEFISNAQTQGQGNPEQVVALMQQVDPKQAADMRQRMVPGQGFATTNEGAKAARDMGSMRDNLRNDLGRLRQILKTPGKSMSLNKRAEADSIRMSLIGTLRAPITGPGAMSDGEREILLNLIPDVTSMTSLDSNSATRLNYLESKFNTAYTNVLKANGIQPNPIGHLQGQERQYAEWALRNQKDPRAKLVLDKLNVPH